MRFHFLNNTVTTSAVLFCTFNKFLNGLKDGKIKCIRLLKLEVEGVSEFYGIVNLSFLWCVGDCMVFSSNSTYKKLLITVTSSMITRNYYHSDY